MAPLTNYIELPTELRQQIHGWILPTNAIRFPVLVKEIAGEPLVTIQKAHDDESSSLRAHYRNLRLVSKQAKRDIEAFFWDQVALQFLVINGSRTYNAVCLKAMDISHEIPFRRFQYLDIIFELNDVYHHGPLLRYNHWDSSNRGSVRIELDVRHDEALFTARQLPLPRVARPPSGIGMELHVLSIAKWDTYDIVEEFTEEDGLSKEMVDEVVLKVTEWRNYS